MVPKTAMCINWLGPRFKKRSGSTRTKLKGRVGMRKKIETVTKMAATTFTLFSHLEATSSELFWHLKFKGDDQRGFLILILSEQFKYIRCRCKLFNQSFGFAYRWEC